MDPETPTTAVTPLSIPFSNPALSRIKRIADWHSGCLRKIRYYHYTPFEIIADLEPFCPSDGKRLAELDDTEAEHLFAVTYALYLASRTHQLNFIDFSRFMLLPGPGIQFDLRLEPVPENRRGAEDIERIMEIFRKHRRFAGLGGPDRFFSTISTGCRFNGDQFYLYHFKEFSSAFLSSYLMDATNRWLGIASGGMSVKIHVKTSSRIQGEIIKRHLLRLQYGKDNNTLFIGETGNRPDNMPFLVNTVRRIAAPEAAGIGTMPGETNFAAAAEELNRFFSVSSFTSAVLIIDRICSRADAEFLDYLTGPLGITGLPFITILLQTGDRVDWVNFDLELNEKPGNKLAPFLSFGEAGDQFPESREEQRLTGALAALFVPVPKQCAKDFLDIIDCSPETEKRLRDTGIIAENPEEVRLLCGATGSAPDRTTLERLLELLANCGNSPAAVIHYYLITGQTEELEHYLRGLSSSGGAPIPPGGSPETQARELQAIAACFEAFRQQLHQNANLLEAAAGLLVEMFDPDKADRLLYGFKEETGSRYPLPLLVKKAHVQWLRGNLPRLDELLREIDGKIETGARMPQRLNDEYRYLQFVFHQKSKRHEAADRFLEQTGTGVYRHRAELLSVDRFIYMGIPGRAGPLLERTIEYFKERGYKGDEIRGLTFKAKWLRATARLDEARSLYLNSFIEGKSRGYDFLAADIAVDLGNLFLEQDLQKTAELWYLKAFAIYETKDNENGRFLVRSNLDEINKRKGDWKKTGKGLKRSLEYYTKHRKLTAMGIDCFNLAHLEFLKHNFHRTGEWLDRAVSNFKKNNDRVFLLECEILNAKIRLLSSYLLDRRDSGAGLRKFPDLSFASTYRKIMTRGQRTTVAILEYLEKLTNRGETKFAPGPLIEKINSLDSRSARFEILATLLPGYWHPALQALFKKLSGELSREGRNYYYYEYFYYQFAFEGEPEPSTSRENNSGLFDDAYFFFFRNNRNILPEIDRIKNRRDTREKAREVFDSARLVDDYREWKLPRDFFECFTVELHKRLPFRLGRLLIFHAGAESRPGEPPEAAFDFNFPKEGDGGTAFRELTGEIAASCFYASAEREWTRKEINGSFQSREKAFYTFPYTVAIPWRLSEVFHGILILAFPDDTYRETGIESRQRDLFLKFGSLFHQFYENTYLWNQRLGFIIGQSVALKQMKEKLVKYARVDFPVLIRGESGTGKELAAKGLHLLSRRSSQAFVPVNAAAIPENLLEAELFGYKKGAFTGASENKIGLVEEAHNGTLFLDEIADLPLNLQAKLLRVLQENEIRRLGETKTRRVDIRLICATNKNPEKLITEGLFREDLYFRIQDLPLFLPPLRDRPEDIPLLVQHFMKKYGFRLDSLEENEFDALCRSFMDRPWPGNIRELESGIKRFITFYPDFDLEPQSGSTNLGGLKEAKERFEKQFLLDTLRRNNWNKTATARELRVSRTHVFRLLEKYGITDEFRLN